MSSIEERVTALEKRVAQIEKGGGDVAADDADLDSQWGDPVVRKDPPRWKGDSYAGTPMSQCPADYLRNLAGFYEWQASMDEKSARVDAKGRPTAPYRRKDAARARGWAKRNEGNVAAPVAKRPAKQTAFVPSDEDMPF